MGAYNEVEFNILSTEFLIVDIIYRGGLENVDTKLTEISTGEDRVSPRLEDFWIWIN